MLFTPLTCPSLAKGCPGGKYILNLFGGPLLRGKVCSESLMVEQALTVGINSKLVCKNINYLRGVSKTVTASSTQCLWKLNAQETHLGISPK